MVSYSTREHEQNRKTQNSGITTKGQYFTHGMKKTELYDYYDYIEEIIELNYNNQHTV